MQLRAAQPSFQTGSILRPACDPVVFNDLMVNDLVQSSVKVPVMKTDLISDISMLLPRQPRTP
jgi:hypothetical protein